MVSTPYSRGAEKHGPIRGSGRSTLYSMMPSDSKHMAAGSGRVHKGKSGPCMTKYSENPASNNNGVGKLKSY